MPSILRTVLVAALSLVACLVSAAEKPLPNPVMNPGTPWVFGGFSIQVPEEEGWVSYFRDGRSMALGRNLDNGRRILGMNVFAASLPEAVTTADELAAQLRTSRLSLVDLKDFTIKSRNETPANINGYLCSRYTLEADAKQDDDYPHIHIHGVTCANPANTKQLVDVGVSDLTQDATMLPALDAVGAKLTQSIRFLPRLERKTTDTVNKSLSSGDIKTAIAMLEPLATAGDTRASFLLADIYMNAKEHQDYVLARKWLLRSAQQGERDALYQLGVMYERGLGTPRDLPEAVKWFKLAADQRDPQAQLNLGILHDPRADGIAKDPAVAAQWFMLSANNGNPRAKQILENFYQRKSGGDKPAQ